MPREVTSALRRATDAGDAEALAVAMAKLSPAEVHEAVLLLDDEGQALLHTASVKGHLVVVKALVELYGADAGLKDARGLAPLFCTTDLSVLEYLLQASTFDASSTDLKGNGVLHLLASLEVTGNDAQRLHKLLVRTLSSGADTNARNSEGRTALHLAAELGRDSAVLFLVNQRGCNINAKTWDGTTPIQLAARKGKRNVVNALLGMGAQVDGMEADEEAGMLPEEMVSLLASRSKKRGRTTSSLPAEQRKQALFVSAIRQGNMAELQRMVRKDKNLLKKRNGSQTVLHVAVEVGSDEALRFLVSKAKGLRNTADAHGETPLAMAARLAKLHACETLLDAKADALTASPDGSVLHLLSSCRSGEPTMFHRLLKRVADAGVDVESRDQQGDTPLHRACAVGNATAVAYLKSLGADIDAKNKSQCTPVQVAARAGQCDIVAMLLGMGAEQSGVQKDFQNDILPTDVAKQFGAKLSLAVPKVSSNYLVVGDGNSSPRPSVTPRSQGSPREAALTTPRHRISTFTEEQQVTLIDRIVQAIENGEAPAKVLKNEYRPFLHKEGTEGLAPLHVACMEEHVEMLAALYDMEVHDLNVYDAFGMNGVLHCAKNGRLQALEWLIGHGADVRAKTVENDRSVLHYLARFPVADCRRVSRMAQLVVGGGVDCDAKTRKQGYTAAHYAVLHGNVNSLCILCDIGCDVDLACNNGMTPAQMAAQLGHVDQLVFLLEQGVDASLLSAHAAEYPPEVAAAVARTRALDPQLAAASVQARVRPPTPRESAPASGATSARAAPAINATSAATPSVADVALMGGGDDPLTQVLVSGGKADLQRLVKKEGKEVLRGVTADGRLPLHVAAAAANLEVCTALLERYKVPIDAADPKGNTALLAAAAAGKPAAIDVCSLLLHKGADPRVIGPLGPLMNLLAAIVCDRDRVTLYKEILELAMRKGASITALSQGRLPMHAAAAVGNIACVLVLLENGCPIDCQAADGRTPLQVAVANEQLSLAKFLSSRGASLEPVRNSDGEVSEELKRVKPAARHVLASKAAIALGEEEEVGRQQLQAAVCQGGRAEVKRLLKKLPARALAAPNHEGSNVLHIATMLGHADLVQLLLERGAEANLPTAGGVTALHLACRQGALDACKALLEHGADPTLVTPAGDSALHLLLRGAPPAGAQALLQEEIVRLLMERGGDAAALSSSGHSAAHTAAYLGNCGALAAMARAPRPEQWLDARSGLSETAMQLAAFRDRSAVVEQLATAGASVSASAGDVRGGHGSWGGFGDAALSLQSLTGEQLQTSAGPYALACLTRLANQLTASLSDLSEPQVARRTPSARPPLSHAPSQGSTDGTEAAKRWAAASREAAGGRTLSHARLGELFGEAGTVLHAGELEELSGGSQGLSEEAFASSLTPALLLFSDAPSVRPKSSRRRGKEKEKEREREKEGEREGEKDRREGKSSTSRKKSASSSHASLLSSSSTSPSSSRVAELEAEVERLRAELSAARQVTSQPRSPPQAQTQPKPSSHSPTQSQRLPRPPQRPQPQRATAGPARAASLAASGKRKSWATRSSRSLVAMAASTAVVEEEAEGSRVRSHFAAMFSRLAEAAGGGGHLQVEDFERYFVDQCTSGRLLNTIVPTVMLEKDLAVPGISEEAFTDFFYSEQQPQVVALQKLLVAQDAVAEATKEMEEAYDGFSSVDKFRSRTYLSEIARSLLSSLESVGAAHAAVLAATDERQPSTPVDDMLDEVRVALTPALAAYSALLLPRAVATPESSPPSDVPFVAELCCTSTSAAATLAEMSRLSRQAFPECLYGEVRHSDEGVTLAEVWREEASFLARGREAWFTAATQELDLSASFTPAQVP